MSEGCCCCSGKECAVPQVTAKLSLSDRFGGWKVRWGINRMNYKIEPGLYFMGEPDENSPVLVSANYKLTFDIMRSKLEGLDCWILILDTKGINVWCAAGKGTFGTEELVRMVETTELHKTVSHRRLILPQLGAPGVRALEVKKQTGFEVVYGPVRAEDIKEFLANDCKATKEMRRVTFNFMERLVLTPMELIPALNKAFPFYGAIHIANKRAAKPLGGRDAVACAGAIVSGAVVTPALLPYIPGRAFAFKGWLVGFCWTAKCLLLGKGFKKGNRMLAAGELLLLPAISSYIAMNFTGSSTYTSPSGVQKEMRKSLPLIVATALGGVLIIGFHMLGGGKRK